MLCVAVVALLALATTWPLWGRYWFPSHEMGRYLLRTFEYVRGWQDGHVFPRWAPDFYGGYGAPTFVLFSPGILALGGIIHVSGVELATSLKLALAVLTASGGLGAFFLVHGETRRLDAALVAASALVFVPYHFVDLYARGDLAEYGAACLTPVALWLYRALGRAPYAQLPRIGFAAAVVHALLIVTHTLLGQWATELLFVVLVATMAPHWRTDRRRIVIGATVLLAALGIAAFYLVPALVEMKLLHVERLGGSYNDPALHMIPIRRFFKFGYWFFGGDTPTDTRHGVRMPFTIGIPLAAAMVFALVCLVRAQTRRALRGSALWWAMTIVLLFVMTPLAKPLWSVLPFSSRIQFPWRLLALVAAVGAAAIGATWVALVPGTWRPRWILALSAVALITVNGYRFVRISDTEFPSLSKADPSMTAELIQRWNEGTAAGEHVPLTVLEMPSQPRSELLELAGGTAHFHAAQLGGTSYRVTVDAESSCDLDLALFYFPGWTAVTDSGPAQVTRATSPKGMVRLHVPQAGHYEIRVELHHTSVQLFAEILTVAFLLGLYPGLRWLVRREQAAQPPAPPSSMA